MKEMREWIVCVFAILAFFGIGFFDIPWIMVVLAVKFVGLMVVFTLIGAKSIYFYQIKTTPKTPPPPETLGVAFTAPGNGEAVPENWLRVTGRANSQLDPHHFRVLHKTADGYYFQHKIDNWSAARKEWSTRVRIGNIPNQEYTLEIAFIPSGLFPLVEYFDDIGNRHDRNHYEAVPISTMKNASGYVALDELQIKYVPPPAGTR